MIDSHETRELFELLREAGKELAHQELKWRQASVDPDPAVRSVSAGACGSLAEAMNAAQNALFNVVNVASSYAELAEAQPVLDAWHEGRK